MLSVFTNSRLCRCSPGLRTAVSSVQAQHPGRTGVFFVPVSCTIIRQPLHWRCRKPTAERRSTAPIMPARRSTPNPSVISVLRCAEHSHMPIVMKPAVSVRYHSAARIRYRTGIVSSFLYHFGLTSRFDGDSDFFPFMYQRILEYAPGSFDIDSRHTIQVRPIGGAAAPNPVDSHTRAALRYNGVDGDTLSPPRAADTTVHP